MSKDLPPVRQWIEQLDTPWRLLLSALRADDSAGVFLQQESLSTDGWNRFVHLGIQHSLLPLLYRFFKDKGLLDGIPPTVVQTMKRVYLFNVSGNLRKISELQKLCRVFHERGIRVLLFKGPVSSQLAYGDPGLRTYSDIDLVIRPPELSLVIQVLREQGYSPGLETTARILRYLRKTGRDFTAASRSLHLDCHQRIAKGPAFFALPAEVWKRTRVLQIQGTGFETFSPEDTVLFLALHCAKDGWNSLKTMYDLARLVRDPRLDWKKIFRMAVIFRSRIILLIALHFTGELLGESLPAEVQKQLDRCSTAKRKFRFFCNRLFTRGFHLDLMTWYSTIPRCLDTVIARLRFYGWFLTHPSPMLHRGFFRIPGPLFLIYPVLAPFFMVWQYFRQRLGGRKL